MRKEKKKEKKLRHVGEAKKSNNKEKLLQLEMEAMKQQQDRIDNLKLQVERKKEVKAKLKSIKEVEEEHNAQEEEELDGYVGQEVQEVIENIEEKVELKEEQSQQGWTDEEYSQVFNQEAKKMRAKIPKEVQHYYDDAVKKFDFTLSLDDNIKTMINYVSKVVRQNAKTAQQVRKVQKKIEDKEEIVQKQGVEIEVEKEIESQIGRLMKMKY